VARILTALKRELPDIHIDESLLTRSRHTRPQTELKKAERIANLTGAFTCPRPGYIRGKTLVLIDDVTTTGATLKEAEKALLPHKPHMIILIAIGH
jgi:predicted amidophosphoribosyltransferase